MNNDHANAYSMFLTLQKICDRHRRTWSTHPAFSDLYDHWNAQVTAITLLSPQQGQKTRGLTKRKRHLRRLAATDALEVAKALRTWALKTGEVDLATRLNHSRDSLLRGRDTATAERCQAVHAAATEHLPALADYGINPAKLLTLQQSISAYTAALPVPRGTIAEKKRATQQLKETFTTARQLLRDGLDNLLPQFQKTAPDFALEYQAARKIIHLPATHKTKKDSDKSEQTKQSESPPSPPLGERAGVRWSQEVQESTDQPQSAQSAKPPPSPSAVPLAPRPSGVRGIKGEGDEESGVMVSKSGERAEVKWNQEITQSDQPQLAQPAKPSDSPAPIPANDSPPQPNPNAA